MAVEIAVLPHERLYLDHLPSADRYSKSFMHRDVINFVNVTRCAMLPECLSRLTHVKLPTRRTDFIITTSTDGHLKLWKKQEIGIEFVKHYRAHLAQVIGVSASADGQLYASVAEDRAAKVFDVVNFGVFRPQPAPIETDILTSCSPRHD